jgi:hypothetical protein
MQRMLVDPVLVDEPMYIKLRARIETFYVNTERVRKIGMTESQQATITQSGFPMSYRIQLHKCLEKMLHHIIELKKKDLKLRQLKEIYTWFFTKLVAMGALSKQEIEEELKFLNPGLDKMSEAMKRALAIKSKYVFSNEEDMAEVNKRMFEKYY